SKRQLPKKLEGGLLCYSINNSAATTSSKDHGVWSLKRLNTIDVIKISIVLNVITHAIHKEVCAATVSSKDELISIVLALMRGYAGNIRDHVRDTLHRLILDLVFRYDANRLRNVAQGCRALCSAANGLCQIACGIGNGDTGAGISHFKNYFERCRGVEFDVKSPGPDGKAFRGCREIVGTRLSSE